MGSCLAPDALGKACEKLSEAPFLVVLGANPDFGSSAHIIGACETFPCAFQIFQLELTAGSPAPTSCHGVRERGLGGLEVGKLA